MTSDTILDEAKELVYGDRGAAYGHPLDDYARTAGAASALLAHKLREPLLAEDVIIIMECVKLSREVNSPKRDNRVDMAGYALCLDRVYEERRARQELCLVCHKPAPGGVEINGIWPFCPACARKEHEDAAQHKEATDARQPSTP